MLLKGDKNAYLYNCIVLETMDNVCWVCLLPCETWWIQVIKHSLALLLLLSVDLVGNNRLVCVIVSIFCKFDI